MKKIILTLFILLVGYGVKAQVTNYSLKFTGSGTVTYDAVDELSGLSTFTVQFWVNPSVWTPGAVLFSRDVAPLAFRAVLGNVSNEIIFTIGSQTITVSSAGIGVNKWSHLTLIVNNGSVSGYVNNMPVSTQSIPGIAIPASSVNLTMGGSFDGRIDEFRIWNVALIDIDYRMWRNTINKYHPNWNNLVVYYKFDQNLCPNVVDYKLKHHGTFNGNVVRDAVTDNAMFKYRINSAYTDFGRWSDRKIDREKYLLANDLIVLGVETYPDGSVDMPIPFNHGTVTNGTYLSEFAGRKGILKMNGTGSQMNVGPRAIDNTEAYTFYTWLYLDEWTEGAFLFKKETSENEGFSVRLGKQDTLVVRLNGKEYKRNFPPALPSVGRWVHVAVTTNTSAVAPSDFFMFIFDGGTARAARTYPPTLPATHLLSGASAKTDAFVGVNLKGKLDETVIWSEQTSSEKVASDMVKLPMPSNTEAYDPANVLYKMNSNWSYDKPDDLGYDYYSYKNFMEIMRSNYANHRGYKIRMSVNGHNNWQTTISNATLRKLMAQGIAKYANEFDGIDLDFEWCYDQSCWNNYGLLADEIAKLLPADKVFSVSPHAFSYQFPTTSMGGVDFFTFQIYGPQTGWFTWNSYQSSYNNFVNWGYPKDKILMSYATITSNSSNGAPPIGVRDGLLDGAYTPDMDIVTDGQGNTRYITGVNQTRRRSEFMQDNNGAGIFYWDMGNDVPTAHRYSLPKISNFAIASNVDSIITSVKTTALEKPLLFNNNKEVTIYPNPVGESFNMIFPDSGSETMEVSIFNVSGQKVKHFTNVSPKNKFVVSELPQGTYMLRVAGKNNTAVYQQKLVKN